MQRSRAWPLVPAKRARYRRMALPPKRGSARPVDIPVAKFADRMTDMSDAHSDCRSRTHWRQARAAGERGSGR